jgi:hypothetical protein
LERPAKPPQQAAKSPGGSCTAVYNTKEPCIIDKHRYIQTINATWKWCRG